MTGGTIISSDQGKGGSIGSSRVNDTISPLSPLYLHPSESPTLSLTQIKFDGDNYALWSDAVRNGLDAKNKLAFVEGTIAKPETLPGEDETIEAVAWRQCIAMVKAWLRNSIEVRLHPSITFSGTVPEIWKELKERHSTGNAPRVHQLKAELGDCKQGKDQSVVDYYTQLKSIWDELGNYSKIPPCTCGAATFLTKEREEKKVHQFLMGLDTAKYGHLRTNLLMEDDVTSLSRAYALVLREERHRAVTKDKEEVIEAAMAVQATAAESNVEGDEIKPPRCTYCKKPWHTEDKCFSKHGYPTRGGHGRGRRGGRGQGRGGRNNDFQSANAASNNDGDGQRSDLTAEEVSRVRNFLAEKTACGSQNQKIPGPVYEDEDWTV